MENKIMNDGFEVVDFDNGVDTYVTSDGTGNGMSSLALVGLIGGGVALVGGIIGAVVYANRDKIRDKKIKRWEQKLNKEGYAVVKLDEEDAD